MKKSIVFLLLAILAMPVFAQSRGRAGERVSQDVFRDRQKEFFIKEAGLTKQEADSFFPLYFELQDKKQALSDETWNAFWKGRAQNLSDDAAYKKLLDEYTDSAIEGDRLDKNYMEKFCKVLPAKKVYLIKVAEMRFRRQMVRGFGGGDHRQGGRHGE